MIVDGWSEGAHKCEVTVLRKRLAAMQDEKCDDCIPGADNVKLWQQAEKAERERDEAKARLDKLESAWRTVCREGNVPQYSGAAPISAEAILHGVRQLASIWSGEKVLRERMEAKLTARVAELERVIRLILECAEDDVREGRADGTSLYGIEAEARAALKE